MPASEQIGSRPAGRRFVARMRHLFGPMFVAGICKRYEDNFSYSQWRWHLDEVFAKFNSEARYLCRTVDHEGEVLEVFATKRRDRDCAEVSEVRDALQRIGKVLQCGQDG